MKPSAINLLPQKSRWLRHAWLAGIGWLYFLLLPCGFALDPARDILQYNCRTWSRQSGLPVNGINAIAQTRDGYLWLGTSMGLVRFDGIEFRLLDLARVREVRNSTVISLASARAGGLWVGLDNSAFGFCDGQTFSFRGKESWGGAGMKVHALLESKAGTLWFAAEGTAARLTPSGDYEELPLNPATNFMVNALCAYEDSQGRIWFGMAYSGAYYWQTGKVTHLPDTTVETVPVNCVAEDREGQIWLGTDKGLRCYGPDLQPREIPALSTEVRSLLVDRQGVLWIGTSDRGLVRYQQGGYQFFRRMDGLAGDYVNALAEDREGSLWVGTRDGLSLLTDVKFPTCPAAENPLIKDTLAVAASRRGGVWIGSRAGITYFDGKPKTYSTEAGLPDNYVKRIFEASNGDVYLVSGNNNLVILSGGKVVVQHTATNGMVVGITEDAQGVVVSVNGALYCAGTNGLKPYAFTNGNPPLEWVLNLVTGRDGAMWASTINGFFRIQDGAFRQWTIPPGPADAGVQWICEDSDGVVWGSQLTGIARLKDNQVRCISRRDGLFDDNIYAIVPDDFGNLWVDSGRGIFRVARQNLNDFAEGRTNHVECVSYDGSESVQSPDKSRFQERVGCKTPDGRIWFPSAKGVVMIDPAHIPTNRVAPPVHVDRILANGRELAGGKTVVVPPGRGELEFHFTALSFIAPEKVRFRYQLEGYDNGWVEVKDRRMAFYTNLKPGHYTFRVTAANADGVWNQAGDSLEIELRPHFYQTAWFAALCGGLVCAALAGLYAGHVRHLTHKQQTLQKARDLLETQVQHRTAELARANTSLQHEVEERKRAEEALRQAHNGLEKRVAERTAELSQERRLLRTLIDNLPDAVYAKDAAGRKTMSNRADLKFLGCRTEAEAIGKNDFDIFPKGQAEKYWADDQRVLRGEPLINREEFVLDENGRECWLLTSKLPLRDPDGKIAGLVGIGRNITELKQAERALRRSHDELEKRVAGRTAELAAANTTLQRQIAERERVEQALKRERLLLRTLIDNLPDIIFAKDAQSRFVITNTACANQLGASRVEEVLGKTDADFVSPELASQYLADEQALMQSGQPITKEEPTQYKKTGEMLQSLTTKVPLKDDAGKVVGLIGIARDITERKRAEETIARERQLLRTLIDRLPETFYIKDLDSRFLVANEAQAEQCGKGTPSQLLGLSDADLFPFELAAEFRAEELKVFAGEPLVDHENTLVFPDGRKHTMLTTKLPFRDSQGRICGLVGIGRDITERKQTEAVLKENQRQLAEVNEMLQMVMDTIPVRIFWKNNDLVYMGCNRLFAKDAGRKSPEEIVGETDFNLGWREQAELYRKDNLEVMRSGNAKLNYEEPQTAPDGKPLWLRTSKVPLRDINNRIVGILGTYEDITERKRAEEALHLERTLTATLMDNIPDAIYFKDAASRFLRVNRAQSSRFGLSNPDQAVGKSDADFFSGEHARQTLADEQEIIRTGRPLLNIEEKETWPDGTVGWVLTTKLPLRDAAGRIIGTCGISRDITERKQVERALAERTEEVLQRNQELAGANATLQQQIAVRERIEQVLDRERLLLRTLIDGLPDYVYAKDAESRFTIANVGVARQFGFSSPNEVIGKSDFDLFPRELAALYHAEEQEILRSGKGLYSYEGPTVDASKPEKNRWVSTTKVPLRNDLGEITGFVGLGHDITERKRMEQVLQQNSKELQERNDELARFTYTVSHDLKSPLVTIKAFIGYLEQDTANQDTEAIKKDRQYIYTAVDKMTRLLDELLDLARIGHKMNPPEEVPLQVVVKDALDMVAGGIIQKGVEVVVTKEPVMLCGDRTRLVEVFQNLVDNAIKFMGDQKTPRVEIGVETAGDERVFFVRDNGMGIDPRYLPKVFGLFEKYDPGTKGSGIGLALVKRIVEVHGGKIWVESAGVGKGATFRFTLAKNQPHPAQP